MYYFHPQTIVYERASLVSAVFAAISFLGRNLVHGPSDLAHWHTDGSVLG